MKGKLSRGNQADISIALRCQHRSRRRTRFGVLKIDRNGLAESVAFNESQLHHGGNACQRRSLVVGANRHDPLAYKSRSTIWGFAD